MNNLDDVRLMAMAVAVGVALVGAAVMGGPPSSNIWG